MEENIFGKGENADKSVFWILKFFMVVMWCIQFCLLFSVKIAKDKNSFFAERINKACKGWGTDDDELIRLIVTRSEVWKEFAFICNILTCRYLSFLHRSTTFNPLPHNPEFLQPLEWKHLKTLWEQEKMLELAFSPFHTKFSTFPKSYITCLLQMLWNWTSLTLLLFGKVLKVHP